MSLPAILRKKPTRRPMLSSVAMPVSLSQQQPPVQVFIQVGEPRTVMRLDDEPGLAGFVAFVLAVVIAVLLILLAIGTAQPPSSAAAVHLNLYTAPAQ